MRVLSAQESNRISGGNLVESFINISFGACQSTACQSIVETSSSTGDAIGFAGPLLRGVPSVISRMTGVIGGTTGLVIGLPVGLIAEGIVRVNHYIFG